MGPAVVERRDAVVLLLARSVPHLKADGRLAQMHRLGQVGACRGRSDDTKEEVGLFRLIERMKAVHIKARGNAE